MPAGSIIHVEYGRRGIQADSMKLIAVCTSQPCKRLKIPISNGFFHLQYAPWNHHLYRCSMRTM